MKQKAKKQGRIANRTVVFSMISSIVLGLTLLVVGLSIFGRSLLQQSISRARFATTRAGGSVSHGSDTVGLARDIMEVYNNLTPEQRSKTGTDEYRQLFLSLDSVSGQDSTYYWVDHIVHNYVPDVSRMYICSFDKERNAMVYIMDSRNESDTRELAMPGDWESVREDWIVKLSNPELYDWSKGITPYEIRKEPDGSKICVTAYPIRDEDRVMRAFVVAELSIDNVISEIVQYAIKISLAVLALTLLIAYISGMRMKKMLADPINAIANMAMTYVQDKKNGIDRTDHFSSLNIQTGDELENLTDVMADMERDLTEHEEYIKRITAEKERISVELNMASEIQSSVLPKVFPAFPERSEFDLYASMTPAREVGGDFYDFFMVDDDHLVLVIADVSGKGVPAAMFMMTAKSLIKGQLLNGNDPSLALHRVNAHLIEGNASATFVTVWLAVVELSTGKGMACNAGHEHPAIQRSGESFELLKYKHNMFVGVSGKAKYQNREFQLGPGDKLFVYTDGVPEAKNAVGEMFGEERMIEALNQDPDATPEGMVANVQGAVDAFVKDAPQFDDLTMLAFMYHGAAPKKEDAAAL